MRTHGTLTQWNDERGFGFIESANGHAEVFVHISEFPRDGVRPHLGELVSYEVGAGKDGKPRATRIMRPGTAQRPSRSRTATRSGRRKSRLASIGGALLLVAIGVYFYFSMLHVVVPAVSRPAAMATPPTASIQPFSCDGRTRCSQMTSCAEAQYFLDHCPGTKIDGNQDGVPCQSQWCGSHRAEWP